MRRSEVPHGKDTRSLPAERLFPAYSPTRLPPHVSAGPDGISMSWTGRPGPIRVESVPEPAFSPQARTPGRSCKDVSDQGEWLDRGHGRQYSRIGLFCPRRRSFGRCSSAFSFSSCLRLRPAAPAHAAPLPGSRSASPPAGSPPAPPTAAVTSAARRPRHGRRPPARPAAPPNVPAGPAPTEAGTASDRPAPSAPLPSGQRPLSPTTKLCVSTQVA
jgi:hypothetical protein